MEILKCEMCGGDIQAINGSAYGTCDYCGATAQLANASDEKIANLLTSDTMQKAYSSGTDSLLRRAYIFLEDGDFDKAIEYLDKVLDLEPENASAYWGLLMAKQNSRTEDQLSSCLIEHVSEYKKALRFADATQIAKYKSIANTSRQKISQKIDVNGSTSGATLLNGGFLMWDFIKPISTQKYFKSTGGDDPTVEWICDTIQEDENPIVKCNNAKVIIVEIGVCTIMDILPALEKVVQSNSLGIIVVCDPCDQELLKTLLINSDRSTLKSLVILLRGNTDNRKELLSAISDVTGARIFKNPKAVKSIEEKDIGIAHEFYACGDKAMFVATPERLQERERSVEEQRRQGLCRHCGGKLSLFGRKCKSCGEKN